MSDPRFSDPRNHDLDYGEIPRNAYDERRSEGSSMGVLAGVLVAMLFVAFVFVYMTRDKSVTATAPAPGAVTSQSAPEPASRRPLDISPPAASPSDNTGTR
jgi:hypothetical protein